MTELFKCYLDACWEPFHWNVSIARGMLKQLAPYAKGKQRKIALIACVRQKREGIFAAGDLFTSAWFIKAKEYVENSGFDEWYILSAKHHLLSPHEEIASYEDHLNQFKAEKIEEWAQLAAERIKQKGLHKDELTILGSGKYRSVSRYLPEATISEPLKGLGISQQMAWLHQQLWAGSSRNIKDCGAE